MYLSSQSLLLLAEHDRSPRPVAVAPHRIGRPGRPRLRPVAWLRRRTGRALVILGLHLAAS